MRYAPKMQDALRANLLRAMNRLVTLTGRPQTQFVRALVGHTSIWARIKKGEHPITTAQYDRMMSGISLLWPDAPWPKGIPRPAPDINAIRRPDALFTREAIQQEDARYGS
jgi:hypothetical protein